MHLVSQELGDELIVYDQATAKVYCLKGLEKEAFKLCSSDSIQVIDESRLQDALASLAEVGLIEAKDEHSRRDFLGKATGAAAAIMVTAVASPAAASSTGAVIDLCPAFGPSGQAVSTPCDFCSCGFSAASPGQFCCVTQFSCFPVGSNDPGGCFGGTITGPCVL